MGKLAYLPLWKENATPEERFLELAMIARLHPERFEKFALIYEETRADGNTNIRQASFGCTTNELLGILQLGMNRVIEDTTA